MDANADVNAHSPTAIAPTFLRDSAVGDRPPQGAAGSAIPSSNDGELIGPYRLLDRLGEGGMGEVYEAEQRHPIRRRVALKIIKAGLDSKELVARFEAERQALAIMNHPYVAKVFDAGEINNRPFFAMELVRGAPITSYADQHRLTLVERIALFIRVCEGVQHAHEKAIVHRDLKPTNILVGLEGDQSIPKIIDFGIAKAVAQQMTETTICTEYGMIMGTLAYMSPEQANRENQDIDTRSDVYSLGVVLYELLVGELPTSLEELSQGGREGALRKIREQQPPKPSMRVRQGDRSTQTANARGVDQPTLEKQLRGDLDWIIMKALEKDRRRRYRSPYELGEDLRCFLANRPVSARPPSLRYQAQKFVRRHRFGVGVATAAAIVALVFVGALLASAGRIASERDRANAEAQRALVEAQTARRVTEFVVGIFSVSDPTKNKADVTARELLDEGAREIGGLSDEPALQARLMETIAGAYHSLGHGKIAESLARDALAISEDLYGPDASQSLRLSSLRCRALFSLGRYAEIVDQATPLLARQRRILGDTDPMTLDAMGCLMKAHMMLGQFELAGPLARENVASRTSTLGRNAEPTLRAMINLGALYLTTKQFEPAETTISESLELARTVLGESHHHTLGLMTNLGLVMMQQGKHERAKKLYAEAVPLLEDKFGATHPITLNALAHQAGMFIKVGRTDEAVKTQRRIVDGYRGTLGNEHPETANAIHNLGNMLNEQGRKREAVKLFKEAYASNLASLGPDHRRTKSSNQAVAELQ